MKTSENQTLTFTFFSLCWEWSKLLEAGIFLLIKTDFFVDFAGLRAWLEWRIFINENEKIQNFF